MNTKQAIKKPINEGMPWEGISIPPRYDLRETGLFYEEPGENADDPPTYVFVCAPLWAVSRIANDLGHWSLRVAFLDHSGVTRTMDIDATKIHGSAGMLSGILAKSGLRVGNEACLRSYLLSVNPQSIVVDCRSTEDEQLIERLKDFLITNQKKLQADGEFSPIERLGFLKGDEICVTASALARAAGDGRTATQIAKVMKRVGFLRTNDDRLQKKVSTGLGDVRLYCLHASILECDTQLFSTPFSQSSTPISTEKPQFQGVHPNSENAETRISNGRTPKTPISDQLPESGQEFGQETKIETIENVFSIVNNYDKEVVVVDDVLVAFDRGAPCPIEDDMAKSMFQKAEDDEVLERLDEWTDFLYRMGYKMSRVLDIRRQSENEPARVRSLLVDAGFFVNPAYQAF